MLLLSGCVRNVTATVAPTAITAEHERGANRLKCDPSKTVTRELPLDFRWEHRGCGKIAKCSSEQCIISEVSEKRLLSDLGSSEVRALLGAPCEKGWRGETFFMKYCNDCGACSSPKEVLFAAGKVTSVTDGEK